MGAFARDKRKTIVRSCQASAFRTANPELRSAPCRAGVRSYVLSVTCVAARLFPGVNLYLLQTLQNLVGHANVDDWEIQRNERDHQNTSNEPFHKNLRVRMSLNNHINGNAGK